MREPANKSLLTDVSGFCFHPCTIIPTHTSPQFPEKTLRHVSTLDLGHKRMRSGIHSLAAQGRPAARSEPDADPALAGGAIALVVHRGRLDAGVDADVAL